MQTSQPYDYIITGAGCAGLSLAIHIIQSQKLGDKKILLVDNAIKNKNDRTWCFWEKENGLFQSIVHKQWDHLWFHSNDFSRQLSVLPFQYKLIRGIDFYEHCLTQIKAQNNFTIIQGQVDDIKSDNQVTSVTIDGNPFYCQYIFNSILFQKPQLKQNQYWLVQHFKGWFIKTAQPQFDPAVATLMDFRTDQTKGSTFFYVLPFSDSEALIEYTLFSHEVLPDAAYETALKNYVEDHLGITDYSILEKEFGVIPMTNFLFPATQNKIINIGTAGGRTKGSSGYTFKSIQKHSAEIVQSLIKNDHPFDVHPLSKKFQFYDSVLLNILHKKTLQGADIFKDLFKNNAPQKVMQFLDNETSITDDLRIISSLPTWPFAKAASAHLF